MRQKACKVCRDKFEPRSSLQQVCSPPCAIDLAKAKREKAFKAETKRRKAAIKTVSDWMNDAQDAFNAFIRKRDAIANQPCITCGEYEAEMIGGALWDAGHFKSKQSHGHLRFNELACHREHSSCNRVTPKRGAVNRRDDMTHDNAYRAGLVERIGLELVEFLEGPHEIQQLRIEDLKWLKKHYTEKAKALRED